MEVNHKKLKQLIKKGYKAKVAIDIKGAPGIGKCLKKGTKVLMFDGTIKKVESVKIGDKLMGPDSKPREVLNTTFGKDKLYKITPVKGEPFVTNKEHILSLKQTYKWNKTHTKKNGGTIHNISVKDYLKTTNNFKHRHKLYRTGVDFQKQDIPLDPYFLGLWLGDGRQDSPCITSNDHEIGRYIQSYAKSQNLVTRVDSKSGTTAKTYRITTGVCGKQFNRPPNTILNKLRFYNLQDKKHIPQVYKINSRENRLKLLAGLIDTDGHMQSNCFIYTSINEQLADDVTFLARSLGFAAYKKKGIGKLTKRNYEVDVFDIFISGDINLIPTKLKRRQAQPRKQIKNVLVTGFEVSEEGIGEYYGFMLDKDGLFLLDDFTVTHNSEIVRDISIELAKEENRDFVFWNKISEEEKEGLLTANLDKVFIFADIRLAQMDQTDLKGFPNTEKDFAKWIPTLLFKVLSRDNAVGTIFFDEMNLSAPSVIASAYSIINDHLVGETPISEGIFMVSAGNRLCFKPGTLILGEDNKPIEKIKKGDKVYGKSGLVEVKQTFKHRYSGKMINIKGRYVQPIECTPEHPILVVPYKEKDSHTTTYKEFSKQKWLTAFELYSEFQKGNKFMLVMPKFKGNQGNKRGGFISLDKFKKPGQKNSIYKTNGYGLGLTLNKELVWAMGLYTAEGWSSKYNVWWSLGAHEEQLIKKLSGVIERCFHKKPILSYNKHNAVNVGFSSSIISSAFKSWFGTQAHNKHIPNFIMEHSSPQYYKAFLKGYIDGDGSIMTTKKSKINNTLISMGTISEILAKQIQLLFAKINIPFGLTKVKSKVCKIRGKSYNCSESYMLSSNNSLLLNFLKKNNDKTHKGKKFHYVRKNSIVFPIKHIELTKYQGIVHNFETEDNTYLVSNCIVHNCDTNNAFDDPAPLNNRRCNVVLNPPAVRSDDSEDWTTWAVNNDIDSRIIGYLNSYEHKLFKFDEDNKDPSFPTPRTWARLSQFMEDVKDLDTIRLYAGSLVGEGIAREFVAFISLSEKVDIRDILENPKKMKKYNEADNLDIKYSIVSGVAEIYKKEKEILNKAMALCQYMEPEFGMFMLRMLKGYSKDNFARQITKCSNWKVIGPEFRKYLLG